MEDSPAGKKTCGNEFIPSPKKTVKPMTNQSQWSFGWQGNSNNANNKPNSSQGIPIQIQVSNPTTIKAASSLDQATILGLNKSQLNQQL